MKPTDWRCENCKRYLGKEMIVWGYIEIICRNCRHINRIEARDNDEDSSQSDN